MKLIVVPFSFLCLAAILCSTRFPDANMALGVGRYETSAIGTEGETGHVAIVSPERVNFFAAVNGP